MSETKKTMENMGFEDIGTGGGCRGWYVKKGKYTLYLTVMSELTLPENGDHVAISIYDKEFEHQYATMDIPKFVSAKAMEYVEDLIEKLKDPSVKARMKADPDEIIYFE